MSARTPLQLPAILSHSQTQIIRDDVRYLIGAAPPSAAHHIITPISFSSCPDTILMASCAAYRILQTPPLIHTPLYYHPPYRLQVIYKLLSFLRRSGLQTPSTIDDFINTYATQISQVLATRPNMILSNAGLGAVIKLIPRQPRYELLTAYFEKHYPTRPRPVIWTNRRFYLEQLTTRSHVLFQGLYHRNCLAGQFDLNLDKNGLPIRDHYLPSLNSLRYWTRMKNGLLHLLSFSDDQRRPLATLSICPPLSLLHVVQGPLNKPLAGTEPFFPDLSVAVTALSRTIPNFAVASELTHLNFTLQPPIMNFQIPS